MTVLPGSGKSGGAEKKRRFFEFDPSIFEPLPRQGKLRRFLIEPAKSALRFLFFILLFSYPLTIVIIGVRFGGLVFWGSFLGSVALIYLLLRKFGYAANFASWDINMRRQLFGLSVGFLLAVGFFAGLDALGFYFFPIATAVIVIGLVLTFSRMK